MSLCMYALRWLSHSYHSAQSHDAEVLVCQRLLRGHALIKVGSQLTDRQLHHHNNWFIASLTNCL
jgi:hypothetical protein